MAACFDCEFRCVCPNRYSYSIQIEIRYIFIEKNLIRFMKKISKAIAGHRLAFNYYDFEHVHSTGVLTENGRQFDNESLTKVEFF